MQLCEYDCDIYSIMTNMPLQSCLHTLAHVLHALVGRAYAAEHHLLAEQWRLLDADKVATNTTSRS
jgi:hypothetical protein